MVALDFIFSLILSASLKGKRMDYLHFIGKETEARRSDDLKALQIPGVPAGLPDLHPKFLTI